MLQRNEIIRIIEKTLPETRTVRNVLLIHPDYSRHDYCDLLVPLIYDRLVGQGLKRFDTLNASGTHRPMRRNEILAKIGFAGGSFPLLSSTFNHEFDHKDALELFGTIPAGVVSEKTSGHLREPMPVTANRLLLEDYDLIIAVSGTIPHEAAGYSGGTKIFFPGVAGPEVIGLLHWAAVLIGIPGIIGQAANPARDIIDAGTKLIFSRINGKSQILSFNMVYDEDLSGHVVPEGLFCGYGFEGFREAYEAAAQLSSKIHIRYLDGALRQVVQAIPEMYDEIWTAGKGSYKLQRPGVLEDGAEIILYAPHITAFHSNPVMDSAIRRIGYHSLKWVLDFCKKHPDFDKNVASHVVNVRGPGSFNGLTEHCAFSITLATGIAEQDCRAVGLNYCDPNSLRPSDFNETGRLWIPDGGKWLYARK